MDSLRVGELEITVTRGDPTIVEWRGTSKSPDPALTISPFFETLARTIKDDEVVIDFTKLEYMNSSTVSPIVSLCKLFDSKQIKTTIRYDSRSKWQPGIFKGLVRLSMILKNIRVEAANPK